MSKLLEILEANPLATKVGPALRIDDLPAHYIHREEVITWESQFWENPAGPLLYHAPIDTTFALYRADSCFSFGPALRLGGRYTFRHLPWYQNPKRLSQEELFYRARVRKDVTSWNRATLPQWLDRLIERRRDILRK